MEPAAKRLCRALSQHAEWVGLCLLISWNEASAASSVRSIKWAGSFDAAGLVAAFGRQPQEAIIEHVPSGSFLRALLLPGFEQVAASLLLRVLSSDL